MGVGNWQKISHPIDFRKQDELFFWPNLSLKYAYKKIVSPVNLK